MFKSLLSPAVTLPRLVRVISTRPTASESLNALDTIFDRQQSSSLIDEFAIVEKLKSIIPSSPEQDPLYLRLRRPKPIKIFPQPPPPQLNSYSLNVYAHELSSGNYQYSHKAEKYVEDTLQDIIQVQSLTLESYNSILEYYVRKTLYHRSMSVKEQMDVHGVLPDISTYNLLLYLNLKSYKSTTSEIINLFNEMTDANLTPNLSTLYITYTNLKNEHQKLLDIMLQKQIKLSDINTAIVSKLHESNTPIGDIITFLQEHNIYDGVPVHNRIIEIMLEQDSEAAWKHMNSQREIGQYVPNTRTAKLFVSHACEMKQPYIAISYAKFFIDKLKLMNKEAIYNLLLDYHLATIQNPKNWLLLAKFYYFKSNTLVPSKLKMDVLNKARLIDPNFKFKIPPDQEDIEAFQEIDQNLAWKNGPVLKLSENSPEYRLLVERYFD